MDERLSSIEDVRQRLGGVGRSQVNWLITTGELRSVKIGRRRLVPESAILEYINRLQQSTA
jgi:excisionase family DNA binding protein